MIHSPVISVIIPIYNVDRYLSQTIDSVIEQDIGFKDNIELILVDDSSPDNSSDICREYEQKYPENIKYIKQKNAGVSAARNNGLKYVHGDFIHFLDADDLISKNHYSQSINFLKENNVSFVASKLMFFDGQIDGHQLNFKFAKTRVIDLCVEPNNPILHMTSCIFRRESIGNIKFHEDIHIAEDVRFISDILINSKKYGVLSNTKYYYRKRKDNSSAINTKEGKVYNYIPTVDKVYQYIVDQWKDSGSRYAEYLVVYDISFRLRQQSADILTENQRVVYKNKLLSVLCNCDDDVIINNAYLNIHQKIFILKNKHKKEFHRMVSIERGQVRFNSFILCRINEFSVHISTVKNSNGRLSIDGYTTIPDDMGMKLLFKHNGDLIPTDKYSRKLREQSFLGDVYFYGGGFKCDIADFGEVNFVIESDKNEVYELPIMWDKWSRMSALRYPYVEFGKKIITSSTYMVYIQKTTWFRKVRFETKLIISIILNFKLDILKHRFKLLRSRNLDQLSIKSKIYEMLKPFAYTVEAIIYMPFDVFLRITYIATRHLLSKKVWIIRDRNNAAGDNGETFFRYINENKKNVNAYFAISKKSADYKRLKQYGRVVPIESLRFKFLMMRADMLISSQAEYDTNNPFNRRYSRFANLLMAEYIFLQHGVTKDDVSNWLNRFDSGIDKIVISTKKEYEIFSDVRFGYRDDDILRTGMPRYDDLVDEHERVIAIMPTYRKWLVSSRLDRFGTRPYDSKFKNTEYVEFYNSLLNNTNLTKLLEKKKIKIEFYVHPVFAEQARDFIGSSYVTVMEYPYDYNRVFRRASALVTDYSSVAFDFGYLYKPVIYTQFDKEKFFNSHSYKQSNIYSYEKDGFGPIFYSLTNTIEGIGNLITSNMKIDLRYKKRIDDMFYYTDANNSERVYSAIISTR